MARLPRVLNAEEQAMTPFPSHLNFGSNCPCGIGTVTGVMDGLVTALSDPHWVAQVLGVTKKIEHSHTFAEVATMLRKAKWREVDRSRFPHCCVRCGGPAFVGFNQVDCADRCAS